MHFFRDILKDCSPEDISQYFIYFMILVISLNLIENLAKVAIPITKAIAKVIVMVIKSAIKK